MQTMINDVYLSGPLYNYFYIKVHLYLHFVLLMLILEHIYKCSKQNRTCLIKEHTEQYNVTKINYDINVCKLQLYVL